MRAAEVSAQDGVRWNGVYNYDAFGNMTTYSEAGVNRLPSGVTYPSSRMTFTGSSFDANGNMLEDGVNSYDFNVHDRMWSANSLEYAYDGENRRVFTMENAFIHRYFVRGLAGEVLAEFELNVHFGWDRWMKDYVYLDDKLVAEVQHGLASPFTCAPPSEFVDYRHWDHVGTTRVVTSENGTVKQRFNFWPYGLEMFPTGSSAETTRKFTGHERDRATGLDYMKARYYSAQFGRFLSADPAPSYSVLNPQAWNRFSYVGGNPLTFVDLSGLCSSPPGGNGLCVEAFIASRWIYTVGLGDHRGFVANDNEGRYSARFMTYVVQHESGWVTADTDLSSSAIFFPFMSLAGSQVTVVSNGMSMLDGSTTFTLSVSALNGWSDILRVAPQDAIDLSLNLSIDANGDGSIEPGSVSDGYPSFAAYSYRNGEVKTLWEKREGKPSDLAKPMEHVIEPSGRRSYCRGY